jgi:hypothetical protein
MRSIRHAAQPVARHGRPACGRCAPGSGLTPFR